MEKFKTLSDAVALAEFAHRHQLDKAGLEYIEHPKRVLAKVQAQGAMPYVQIAAILHDVTEDTAFTPEMLLELGFSEAAVRIVVLLDRSLSADKWFEKNGKDIEVDKKVLDEFYYKEIAKDPGARMVKLADIEDNLSPWRLAYLEEATQNRLRVKYSKAQLLLNKWYG